MIISRDCPHCYGLGRVHSPGKTGDPDDDGLECTYCEGSGVEEIDVEDEIEE